MSDDKDILLLVASYSVGITVYFISTVCSSQSQVNLFLCKNTFVFRYLTLSLHITATSSNSIRGVECKESSHQAIVMPLLVKSKIGNELRSLGGLSHPYHLLERLLHELVNEEEGKKHETDVLYIIFQDKESISSLCHSKISILFLTSILSRGGYSYKRYQVAYSLTYHLLILTNFPVYILVYQRIYLLVTLLLVRRSVCMTSIITSHFMCRSKRI